MPKVVSDDKKRVPLNCLVAPETLAWLKDAKGSQGELIDKAVAALRAPSREVPYSPEVEAKIAANVRPRRQSKRERVVEELAASDLTARAVERDDIEYGLHTELPKGEHVANLRPAWKREPRQKGDKSR